MENTPYCIADHITKKINNKDYAYTLESRDYKNPQCVVLENQPTDSRFKICENNVFQTLTSRMGTGGNNVPMVLENHPQDSRFKIREDGIFPTMGARQGGEGDPNTLMVLENKEEPILLESNQNHATVQTDGISTTLPASMGMGGGYVPMVTDSIAIETHPKDSRYQIISPETNQCIPSIMCHDAAHGGLVMVSEMENSCDSYGFDRAAYNQGKNAKYDFAVEEELAQPLVARGPGGVMKKKESIIRRLTPMECERLQGYPDGWTDIGDWVDSKGKKHKGESDSPRYKALGNSIALPFWEWMAGRIADVLREEGTENPTMASLFDGISGFCLVSKRCGIEPIWSSEIEEFPIAVAKKHFGDDDNGVEGDVDKYL